VTKVLYANTDLPGFVAESVAPLIVASQEQFTFSHIFAGATAQGKNILPRVAAKLDVAMLSEITSVESEDTFGRTIYAGNAIATVKSNDAIKVCTVRPTNFEPCGDGGAGGDGVAIDGPAVQTLSAFVSKEEATSDRPSLAAAGRVVAGGKGMKDGANFAMLETMADKLGAAVGASRAAVDAGYVPNEYQIGQTGKIIAPELYIAVGISGAIQHLAGMKDSKVIACVNKDPEAPIFQVSDYGLVADLFDAVPEINDKL
jgi:electron transfer flavoprotein alpha subunit